MGTSEAGPGEGWDKPTEPTFQMAGLAAILVLFTILPLVVIWLVRTGSLTGSESQALACQGVMAAVTVFAWATVPFLLMAMLSLRAMTRGMVQKRFYWTRRDQVIGRIEGVLDREGLPYRRLSLTGDLPREPAPHIRFRNIVEIFVMDSVSMSIIVQKYVIHRDPEGSDGPDYTPVYLGPELLGNQSWFERIRSSL